MADGAHMPPLPETVRTALKNAVGDKGWYETPADMAPYLAEERNYYHGESPLVLRPANTEEVSKIVTICAEHGVTITPQGGNTGLCGGAVAQGGVLINLGRMNTVREIDPVNATMTVEAGCRGPARSAATSRPMPAAFRCCATATPAISCWGWRSSLPTAACGTGCAASARTTRAMT